MTRLNQALCLSAATIALTSGLALAADDKLICTSTSAYVSKVNKFNANYKWDTVCNLSSTPGVKKGYPSAEWLYDGKNFDSLVEGAKPFKDKVDFAAITKDYKPTGTFSHTDVDVANAEGSVVRFQSTATVGIASGSSGTAAAPVTTGIAIDSKLGLPIAPTAAPVLVDPRLTVNNIPTPVPTTLPVLNLGKPTDPKLIGPPVPAPTVAPAPTKDPRLIGPPVTGDTKQTTPTPTMQPGRPGPILVSPTPTGPTTVPHEQPGTKPGTGINPSTGCPWGQVATGIPQIPCGVIGIIPPAPTPAPTIAPTPAPTQAPKNCTLSGGDGIESGGVIPHGSTVSAYDVSSTTAPDTCNKHKQTYACEDGTLSSKNGSGTAYKNCTDIVLPPPPPSCLRTTASLRCQWPSSISGGGEPEYVNCTTTFGGSLTIRVTGYDWALVDAIIVQDTAAGRIRPTSCCPLPSTITVYYNGVTTPRFTTPITWGPSQSQCSQ